VQIPNLRELRELRGLTQKELADVSGVSLRSVAGYEGGAQVRPNTARKLAQALHVEVADLARASSYPKAQAPQPSLEDAARSEELQEELAVLFRGLALRGERIVNKSLAEGPSESLSEQLHEYRAEATALLRIKKTEFGPDIFGHDSDELAEAVDAYWKVDERIHTMTRQDVEASDEERNQARRFTRQNRSDDTDKRKADAS
jgi:transcriptional regulator with XRE-family HTH domain